MGLHYDIALMKGKRREGFSAIAISCLSQVVYAVCWYLIARSLSQDVDLIYFLHLCPSDVRGGIVPVDRRTWRAGDRGRLSFWQDRHGFGDRGQHFTGEFYVHGPDRVTQRA